MQEAIQSKLIEMYEAREAILNRLNSDFVRPDAVSVIDIDKFLQAAVTEVGQRLAVDRCNVITPSPEGGFRVSHEYLGDHNLTPGLGLNIPSSLVPFESIKQYLPRARHYSVDDTLSANIPAWVKTTLQLIGTRSVLVAPFVYRNELLGVMGLHYCHEPHRWSETEVKLVEWLAGQVSIGLQYTQLYQEKEKEVEITKLMLEISNDINTRTDFNEITDFVIDRALGLLKADYGCIAILDNQGEQLHFDELRARRGFDLRKSVEPKYREARTLRLPDHPAVRELLDEGQTLRLEDSRTSPIARYLFSQVIKGKSALVSPITVKEKVLGIVALVWVNETAKFSEYDVQVLNGISSQVAIALEKDRLAAEVIRLKRELNDARAGERIIGSAPKIRRAIEMALSVADSSTTVLLQGESGTGKELIASLLQFNSRRASRPFVKINCGAIPQPLLETELFGHERGAFTDARSRRIGRFEEANGGTLFLDEIGEMSLAAQVSLLRVLQDGEFTRVGGNEVIKTDVRVIAATNKDLEKEIEEGRFRRDLFYRLNVYPIVLPPLRERTDDIEQLVAYFIERFQQKSGKRVAGISDQALRMLKTYPWPGNVRELENCVERAVIVAAGRVINEQDLPETIRAQSTPDQAARIELNVPMKMEDVEQLMINQTLLYTSGDKAKAARLLGIGRKTLYRKLEQYKK
ncbi:MAG TPA: sigma 54-interacting transcriptional regulator [Blastocatellia bacterium]|nr:sigma 54-interacting transcriptional regulator [Blastocatellia bacterium]HMX27904.1 sigma 54-interacting transcriptional regulator [Blastocatellia bacterium]HNG30901.1 sigma 54-interacting transcriptional regulator [Blastocatellia bacterium]